MCGKARSSSNLVSEHEGNDFQHVHTPLLLALSRRQKLDQVIKPAHVNGPQHPIVYAGIIIHLLLPERGPRLTRESSDRRENNPLLGVKVKPSLHRDLQVHEARF